MANNPTHEPSIKTARLIWRDGQPVSEQFGDVYFSRENGLEETRYVFLRHNHLPERFRQLSSNDAFVIAETGFGTGLNFLTAWQAFCQEAPANARLHFVSVERYPLGTQDLERALALWPELAPYARQLVNNYPQPVTGCHRLVLNEGRVRLTLYFGDAVEGFDAMDFHADAWFLDGFAPACNPGLWQDQLIRQVREHSHQGTTLATFTAAGRVRRALAETGFRMERVDGFGPKRDMIRGVLEHGADRAATEPGHVLVVGAGIAGASIARNLAVRGYQVTVADQGEGPGAGASGNPQGALYAKLGVQLNDQTRLALAALLHAQRFYPAQTPDAWHQTGLLMMGFSEQERERQQKFLAAQHYPESVLRPLVKEEASTLTGVPCPQGGLWFPGSGWLEPALLCSQLLDHPRIQTEFGFRATRLLPCNNHWCLSGNGRQDLVADTVILAAGHLTRQLMPVNGEFRMKAIRGQITRLPATHLTRTPRAVITGARYLNPPNDGQIVTGATFDLRDTDPEVRPDSHRENLSGLDSMLPGLLDTPIDLTGDITGRVAFRCTTHDYQPVAGPLVNGEGHTLGGAWLLTGLGSKGLMWAPLMAEYLADLITGEPLALPHALARRVSPERCLATTQKQPRTPA
ncbi:bifunctional tRNA (5-methylaminomethyl-2-thiouridine)(34)-methyltransferase MnmD/FAD-dependent 5-carboxymethylaminomethyl-2-thiouridine(34) oxidoreductase MnmC [Marinobacter sp.]|uniref:bifunctional tRNA (5-methylaminomethyl-2-thiouridine)(34)-methyltransferase MnmD/FAD-dependent 5-carboxymethylaminomethyl-2-thiouridine(34) oxidoreductase MnmC n=1 Tax=Marinobacter sp. TaxID=50741 RepID=UPI00356499A8